MLNGDPAFRRTGDHDVGMHLPVNDKTRQNDLGTQCASHMGDEQENRVFDELAHTTMVGTVLETLKLRVLRQPGSQLSAE